jgi:hypothetical protein
MSIYSQPTEFFSLGGVYDEFTQATTWTPYHSLDLTQPLVYLSIVKTKSNKVVLFVNAQYIGSEWVFMNEIILLYGIDSRIFKLQSITRKVLQNGMILEHGIYPIETNESDLAFLRLLTVSGNGKVRYQGKYNYDRELTPNEISLLTKYISAYDKYLKNKPVDTKPNMNKSTDNSYSAIVVLSLTLIGIIYYLFHEKRKKDRLQKEYLMRKNNPKS